MRYAACIEKLGAIEAGFVGGTRTTVRANTLKALEKNIEKSRWWKSKLKGMVRNTNKVSVKIMEYPIPGIFSNAKTIDFYIEENGERQ